MGDEKERLPEFMSLKAMDEWIMSDLRQVGRGDKGVAVRIVDDNGSVSHVCFERGYRQVKIVGGYDEAVEFCGFEENDDG